VRLLPLSLLLCVPLLAACGKQAGDSVAEAMIERSTGTDAEVERKDGRVDIQAKGAHVQIAEDGHALELPADFPADVYRPEGFRVRHVMDVPEMLMLTGEAQGDRAELFAQARASMAQQGWKEVRAGRMGQADSAMFRKEKREMVMTMMDRNGLVQLSMQLQKPKSKS
jgi:hypothetical protein